MATRSIEDKWHWYSGRMYWMQSNILSYTKAVEKPSISGSCCNTTQNNSWGQWAVIWCIALLHSRNGMFRDDTTTTETVEQQVWVTLLLRWGTKRLPVSAFSTSSVIAFTADHNSSVLEPWGSSLLLLLPRGVFHWHHIFSLTLSLGSWQAEIRWGWC